MEQRVGRIKKVLLAAAGIVSLCIFSYAAFHLAMYYLEYRLQQSTQNNLQALREQSLALADVSANADRETFKDSEASAAGETTNAPTAGQLKAMYRDLKDVNGDYVFWLTIPDTGIDFPVVQMDNEYYLQFDFYNERNSHGTIFLDESCDSQGKALLVHGHHMKDGTMFAPLVNYKKEAWRGTHREALVYTQDAIHRYQIFAAARVDLLDEHSFRYEELPSDGEGWRLYVDALVYRAFWYEDPDYAEDDRLLILSTCDYGTEDERLVVFGIEHKNN